MFFLMEGHKCPDCCLSTCGFRLIKKAGILIGLFTTLLVGSVVFGQNQDVKVPTASTPIEQLTVVGEFIEGSRLDLVEMQQIYKKKDRVARQFKLGRYREAFPGLLKLAKLGMKDSQARVAFIYLHGLGGVPKSNLKALGWLATAATPDTRPQYRNLLKKLLAQVPSEMHGTVDRVIADFRSKYDSRVRGVNCEMSRLSRGLKFSCRFDDEMWQQLAADKYLYERIVEGYRP